MSAIEDQIIQKLKTLDENQKQVIWAFIGKIAQDVEVQNYSASYLMSLPPDERKRLMAESLALASDKEFEIFEAYEEEPIDESD